jgi:hypothetical protein
MIRLGSMLAALACLGLSACDRIPFAQFIDPGEGQQEREDEARLDRLRAQIEALVGQASCNRVEECRYIGLGAKPCGGNWRYLVYSTAVADPEALAGKVAQYNAFEADMNRRYGRISDCSLPAFPALGRYQGRCVDLREFTPQGTGFREDGVKVFPDGTLLYPDGRVVAPDPPRPPAGEPVRVARSPDELPASDPFTLVEVGLRDDELTLVVSHGGGCAVHRFALWALPSLSMSPLPNHDLVLTHDDPDDPCDSIVTETLRFDLSPLRELYPTAALVILRIGDRTLEWKMPTVESLRVVESLEGLPISDPFQLDRARIEGDLLILDVSHSGGCAAHDFALWTTRAYEKSLPPQHHLVLTHDARGDLCEAYIARELRFDLSPLKAIHQAAPGGIVVRLGGSSDSAGLRLDYVF